MHLMRERGLDRPPGCVTADYAIRLRRPTPTDRPVHLRAWPVERTATGSSSTPNWFRWHHHRHMPRHVRRRRTRPPRIRALVEEPHVRPFLRSPSRDRADVVAPGPAVPDPAGDTATVRRIVAKLEAMPPEQARLIASAAYTLARAANADLDISDEETAAIERELQDHEALDEATAVLVTEMAKLQAKTVGGTEDYVVTREFKALADDAQRIAVVRACYRGHGGQRHDLRRGDGDGQRDRRRARHRRGDATLIRAEYPRAVLVGPADPARHPGS